MRLLFRAVCAALFLILPSISVAQQSVRVTVENLQSSDGFFVTPVWVGFHNGGFDYFDAGSDASTTVENLAEEGDVSGLVTDFGTFGSGQDGVITGPSGFGSSMGQPPVIDPGESVSAVFDLAATERYLSFGTMIIPSNDGFFGNDSGTAYEILDGSGNFVFSGPLEFTLANVWDAGTELNDGLGAAFSANGGSGTTEDELIRLHPGLSNFDGTSTAAGTTINFANASANPVLRISITAVPEPGSLSITGLVGCCALFYRRRRKI